VIPQVNVVVLKVERGGTDTWDLATDPTDVWSGGIPGYLNEKRQRTVAGGGRPGSAEGTDVFVWRSLVLPGDLPWEPEPGDLLTIEHEDGRAFEAMRVREVERRALAQIPAHLRTNRLTMEAA